MSYRVNEIFYSVQGEGVRAGTPNVFLRLSGCNLACTVASVGFDCDTEFSSGRDMSAEEIVSACLAAGGECRWVVLTGGEPALQLDQKLVTALKEAGYKLAVETNGTKLLPSGLDWVCVSPKTAEHTLAVDEADEVKYVRNVGQGVPKPLVRATHRLISPASGPDGPTVECVRWCLGLVRDNPDWRLSLQLHKILNVR